MTVHNDQGTTAPASGPLRVLLVEDEALVRLTTSDMLAELGHAVEEAADGREALSLLDNGAPVDLLVTDLGLPDMTGEELAAECRKRIPRLPVIFATGYDSDRVKAAAADPLIVFLGKPFLVADLSRALDALAAHRGEPPRG